jgi:hypothetical protein
MNANSHEFSLRSPIRRLHRGALFNTFAFVLAFLLVLPAQARDWIVNPEKGTDTNDGSVNTPLATAQVHPFAARHPVVEFHALHQVLHVLLRQLAHDAHRVFAFQAKPRVHQFIGQLTRIGEQQQAFGVQVKTAH